MAKPLYVYTGSQWVPVASELESTSQYATTTYVDNKVGLDHINTTTFSGVSSISINNIFSSTYENYRIIGNINNSAATTITLRLRAAGSDASGANYGRYGIQTGASNNNFRVNQAGETSAFVTNPAQPSVCFMITDIIQPNVAIRTFFAMNNFDEDIRDFRAWTVSHGLTTQYDGFSLLTASGTITGNIRVYGYKD